MGFKEYYNKLNEAPHISLEVMIDFEAEKNLVISKLLKLLDSVEEWQKEEIVTQILKHNIKFPLFVRNELKVLEQEDPIAYEKAISKIPEGLR